MVPDRLAVKPISYKSPIRQIFFWRHESSYEVGFFVLNY